jgi:cellulose synthase/poly-beta-1,6-N-acetylglucosamine synthase-like glycosyltransferase
MSALLGAAELFWRGAAELVWLAALGVLACAWTLWPAALGAIAAGRRRRAPPRLPDDLLPAVAVLVPTLDEGAWIDARLDDLARTDYPRDRMRVVVVDGGSRDATAARVRARAAGDRGLRLLELPATRSKSEQVAEGLAWTAEEIAIVTDADVALAPDAIRRLVEALLADPRAGAVGAWVEPASPLAEERLHWALVNRLWWLEGEALGAALFSGACYALRTKAAEPPPADALADDAHLALGLVARGWRVRVLPTARVLELRVPHSPRELVAYRRRRGAAYLHELHRPQAPRERLGRAAAWRLGLVRSLRRLQTEWTPRAAGLLLALAPLVLVTSPRRGALALAAGLALAPGALSLAALALAERGGARPWAALGALARLLAYELVALVLASHGRRRPAQPR